MKVVFGEWNVRRKSVLVNGLTLLMADLACYNDGGESSDWFICSIQTASGVCCQVSGLEKEDVKTRAAKRMDDILKDARITE